MKLTDLTVVPPKLYLDATMMLTFLAFSETCQQLLERLQVNLVDIHG